MSEPQRKDNNQNGVRGKLTVKFMAGTLALVNDVTRNVLLEMHI